MTFAQFQRLLKEGAVPPVLVFHGDEPFLARLGVDLLKRSVLQPGSEAFDLVVLSGRETTAEAIAAQASTAPMLAERRLAIVYEFEQLPQAQRKKLLDYVRRPVESACVALVSFDRLAGKNAFERDVLAAASVVDCGRAVGTLLRDLVVRMAEERGKAIEEDALTTLLDWTDGRLNRVANELDKLACFVEDGEPITLEDIEQAVGARASGLAELATAIAERRPGDALSLMGELVDGGFDPAQLVSQLYGYWIALWLARAGGPSRGGGGFYGAPSALADGRPLSDVAGVRTSREYAAGVELFYTADVDIRRGMPPGPTVGLLVYELSRRT